MCDFQVLPSIVETFGMVCEGFLVGSGHSDCVGVHDAMVARRLIMQASEPEQTGCEYCCRYPIQHREGNGCLARASAANGGEY